MQSEIINEIIEVEDKASMAVENSKSEANLIIGKANIKAKQIVKDLVRACKQKNQIEFEKVLEQNNKELTDYQMSLKEDYSNDKFDYDSISSKLAEKICNSSVFET
ncbi:MAG: hypothetical protein JJE21_03230 [Spirochaetaceae bacterium]|nr:hypothetical protein [Spirochaetaceae bacterium]